MSKKNKIKNPNQRVVFFILFILTPFVVFGIDTAYRYYHGGDVSVDIYFDNFKVLYEAFKNYTEYVFPSIIMLLIGFSVVFVQHLSYKPVRWKWYLFYSIIGLAIYMFSYRLLFFVTHNYLDGDFKEFMTNGISLYSVTLSLMYDFLACSVVRFFDCRILK